MNYLYYFAAVNFADPNIYPGAKVTNLSFVINLVLGLINVIGIGSVFIVFMMAAYKWLSAGDKAENLTKAQQMITYAIVGIILVVSSNLIVRLIGTVLHVEDQIPL